MLEQAEVDLGRRAFRLTLAGTLVSALGQGLTLPYLFVYLHDVLGAPLPVAGVVLAVASVVGLGATTLGGPLGDRAGLGRLAWIGLLVQAAGTAVLAAAPGAGVASAGVALNFIGNALVWPALNGLVAVQIPAEGRSRAYALRFGMLNAGIGVGGLLSGWIVSVREPASFHLVYGVDAATTAVFAVLILAGLRGSPGYRSAPRRAVAERGGYAVVLRDRAFVGYLAVALAFGVFGYAQLNGPWASFVTGAGGSTTQVVGFAFAANTAAIVVLQLGVERWTRPWRRSRMLVATAVIWGIAWVISAVAALPVLHGPVAAVAFVVSLAVFGLGETFYSPIGGGMPNALAPEHLRARYNALAASTWPLGGFIGPPLAGVLLGGSMPLSWVAVIAVGMAVTAVVAAVLGARLPSAVERPAV
ncbi:MFS transporter [uncultured Amnibacterium sp.]|uniref:MFS transporter n=1 Tax=uncultured Amnibacterium sp. TaxID=1631851 RepID=UPI0035CC81D5